MAAGNVLAINHIPGSKAAFIPGLHICRCMGIGGYITPLVCRIFRQIAIGIVCHRTNGDQVHISPERLGRIDRQPVSLQRKTVSEHLFRQVHTGRLHLLINLHKHMVAFRGKTNFIPFLVHTLVEQCCFLFAAALSK